MNKYDRGPSIYAYYQVSFIWQSGFRGKDFEIDQPETRIAFGGHIC